MDADEGHKLKSEGRDTGSEGKASKDEKREVRGGKKGK